MNRSPFVAGLAAGLTAIATALPAQGFLELPSTAMTSLELPDYSLLPLMQPNARVQMFYDATEIGLSPFVADRIEFRFDGPIPQVGAPGPFAIQQLTIKVGMTTVPQPGAGFADNLSQPLTTVFDGPWSFLPDNGSAFPHPWGGPGGGLTFDFQNPVPIAMQPGEWFVVDLTMVGNNIAAFGYSHAILDGEDTTGGVVDGTAAPIGQGCSAGAGLPAASASAVGIFAPGAAHFLRGQNLGANAAVLGIFGLENGPGQQPFTLPGTACTLIASPDLTLLAFADTNGAVTGTALTLALPANPTFSGFVLYEQLASLVPGANPFGIVLSSGAQVTLGSFTPPGRGTYTVAHDVDATASYANVLQPFGYAMRVRTL